MEYVTVFMFFTWRSDSFHLSRLQSRGGSVWFWPKFKMSTVCALTDYLKIGSSAFAWSWLNISVAGATYCTNVFWAWIEPFCVSRLSNILLFSVCLFWNTDTTPRLFCTSPSLLALSSWKQSYLSNSCVCACVHMCLFVCVRVRVLLVFLSLRLPESSV